MHDAAHRLEGLAKVGMVHPLHLTDEQRSAWGEIFGDYEIMPPFPQLGRAVHRLTPEERAAREIVRNKGIKIPGQVDPGRDPGTKRLEWSLSGDPGEHTAIVKDHSKPFEGTNVTALIEYGGIEIGYGGFDFSSEDPGSGEMPVRAGSPYARRVLRAQGCPALGEVDPVVMSEVSGTLGVLASKGK